MHGSKQLLRGDLGGLLFCKRNGMFLFMLLRMQNRSRLETQFAHPSFFEKDKTVVMFHPNRPLPEKITEFSESHLCKSCEVRKKNTWCTALNRISITFPLRLKKHRGRATKNGRARGWGRVPWTSIFWTPGGCGTQHLTASVTAAAQDPPTNITSLTLHIQSQHSGGI